MKYCSYYQGHINKSECWFLVGGLKLFEHLVFLRTFNVEKSIFEFFVPEHLEKYFEEIMSQFQEQGVVLNLEKLPNRLLDENEIV